MTYTETNVVESTEPAAAGVDRAIRSRRRWVRREKPQRSGVMFDVMGGPDAGGLVPVMGGPDAGGLMPLMGWPSHGATS